MESVLFAEPLGLLHFLRHLLLEAYAEATQLGGGIVASREQKRGLPKTFSAIASTAT